MAPPPTGCALPSPLLLPGSEAAGQWDWTSKLVQRRERRYTLHLSGSLHFAWAGRLAAGLAARNVSVVRASARRGATRWTAEIDLEVAAGAAEPSAIDFIALMREHRDPAHGERVVLSSFRVTPTRRELDVEVRAADEVGFLGRVLLVFGELGLYPHAMRVETVGSAVRDRFLLQDANGGTPSAPTLAALRRRLEGLVREA